MDPIPELTLLAAHERDRVGLAVHLAQRVLDAAVDLADLGRRADVPGLHARFVGWILPRGSGFPDGGD